MREDTSREEKRRKGDKREKQKKENRRGKGRRREQKIERTSEVMGRKYRI